MVFFSLFILFYFIWACIHKILRIFWAWNSHREPQEFWCIKWLNKWCQPLCQSVLQRLLTQCTSNNIICAAKSFVLNAWCNDPVWGAHCRSLLLLCSVWQWGFRILQGYQDRGIWGKLKLFQPGRATKKEGPSSICFTVRVSRWGRHIEELLACMIWGFWFTCFLNSW